MALLMRSPRRLPVSPPLFLLLLLSPSLLATVDASSATCDVAFMDDPLDYPTLYAARGQHKAQLFPAGTEHLCDYYASAEYAEPPGACCSGAFVDNVVYPLLHQLLNDDLSMGCKRALERAACFACARSQSDFLTILYDEDNLRQSTSEVKICKGTCHTIYEHCKGDREVYLDNNHMVSEEYLCQFIDDSIANTLTNQGANIQVTVVDEGEAERPECFLYDDLGPTSDERWPAPLAATKPTNGPFKLVFDERMRRTAAPASQTQGVPKISLRRVKGGKEVSSVAAGDARHIQIVTTNTLDDTVLISFPLPAGETCLMDTSGSSSGQYEIVMPEGVLEDTRGNSFAGVAEGQWQFSTDGSTQCVMADGTPADGSAGGNGGATAITVAVVSLAALGVGAGAAFCFFKQRRRREMNYMNQVDFGDDVTLEPGANVSEGTTVTGADGQVLQVRLVPAYDAPSAAPAGKPEAAATSTTASSIELSAQSAEAEPGEDKKGATRGAHLA